MEKTKKEKVQTKKRITAKPKGAAPKVTKIKAPNPAGIGLPNPTRIVLPKPFKEGTKHFNPERVDPPTHLKEGSKEGPKKAGVVKAIKTVKKQKVAHKLPAVKKKEPEKIIKPAIVPYRIIPPKEKIVITPKPVAHVEPKPEVVPIKKEDKPVAQKKPAVSHVLPKVEPVASATIAKKEEKPPLPEKPVVAEKPVAQKPAVLLKTLELDLPITVKDLSVKLQEKSSVVIKTLMGMGVMAGINELLDESAVSRLCQGYGFQIQKAPDQEEQVLRTHQEKDAPALLRPRAPIVTLMGHVDHGKTSLLDAIRKTKVADSEHGGITQHIGAYRVILPGGEITFLDTPGHEAFTAMRARGASITDIVILVVAADDGIMPQTEEAIDHARAAGVPIVVAINKVDKPQADLDRVKKQLAEHELMAEDWGGKTITVAVSAKTGQGIDNLLDMLLLEAQMLELKANPQRDARGVVVEARLTKGRGPVVTLLVQNGTLRLNANVIVDKFYGKIRAMFNDHGKAVIEVGPSFPVEVLGLSGVPAAGEQFFAVEDEKTARQLSLERQEKKRQQHIKSIKRISLEDLYAQIKEGKLKELKLIIKADVQGSLEAIKETLNKLDVSEIKIEIIHQGVGNINSSDVVLAVASNALILGFNVVADERAKELIAQEGVDARVYNIIYELANDIKAALEGMLEPKLKKVFVGRVEIRKVFKLSSRAGAVAGCFVSKGKVNRSVSVTLVRNGSPVFEGKLSSLKRFKDDVKEVAEGFECGITLAGFDDLKEGDIIEAYDIEKIARKL